MTIDLTLCLVTDTALCGSRGVVPTVRAAVKGGATAVQLRDKDASARELCALAASVREALDGEGVPLLVNDRLDVALAAGADGVHLGQSDLPVEPARRLAGPDFVIGLSVSTMQELRAADALPRGTVDYLGVSPVFGTPTKPDAADAVGLDGLGAFCAGTQLPCVAIGGIGPHNAAAVRATGVAGIAVVSAICAADDVTRAAASLRGVEQ